ncbi:MAG TPA: hypothetical protein VFE10_00455 [Phenylobacterium sp.]|jgi:hypothetical protein|nr:hypothetical protein [Phenylobacterium sp.]
MDDLQERRIHDSIGIAGLRAHATAVGLLQLSLELVRAGVLDANAIGRIKDAITHELVLQRPRSAPKLEFEQSIRSRLDSLFCEGDASEAPPASELH